MNGKECRESCSHGCGGRRTTGLPVLAEAGVELVAGHVQLSKYPAQKVAPDRKGVLGMEREGLPISAYAHDEAAASMLPFGRECRKESSRLTTVEIGQSCGHPVLRGCYGAMLHKGLREGKTRLQAVIHKPNECLVEVRVGLGLRITFGDRM